MLLALYFFNNKFVKVEVRMKRFLRVFFWESDFLSLFCWVRIKIPFPLFSPASNFIKVLIQYICSFRRIRNYRKQRSIISKQLDIQFRSVAKSFMYIRKKRGLNIDPCGTPARKHSQSEVFPLRVTLWTLSLRTLFD